MGAPGGGGGGGPSISPPKPKKRAPEPPKIEVPKVEAPKPAQPAPGTPGGIGGLRIAPPTERSAKTEQEGGSEGGNEDIISRYTGGGNIFRQQTQKVIRDQQMREIFGEKSGFEEQSPTQKPEETTQNEGRRKAQIQEEITDKGVTQATERRKQFLALQQSRPGRRASILSRRARRTGRSALTGVTTEELIT